ncbi:MAG: hypothetical protein JXC36_03355 [Candidatus Atribacteria bacterium]|nr:hypothetical protein [Candidatus Atribacteria bacterium]
MKVFIVYFSRSGRTKKLAEQINQKIPSDLEEIKDHMNRKGIIGFLKSGNEAYFNSIPLIHPLKKDPTKYDIVIIGTPVWANNIASPVRSFLKEYKDKLEKVAFFCTSMGSDPKLVFAQMGKVIHKEPVAVLNISSRDERNRLDSEMIDHFVQTIKKSENEKIKKNDR